MNVCIANHFSRRRPRFAKLSCLAILPILLAGLTGAQNAAPDDLAYAAGELLIKFKAGASDAQVQETFEKGKLGKVKRTFKMRKGGRAALHLIATEMDVPAAAEALAKHPAVEYAEPNYKVYPAAVPNDPQYSSLWAMPKISAPAAWDVTTGSSSVIIGVLDTGIDISHPDLAANIWTNTGEVPGDGIDNDSNGYIDDVNGWDWWNGDNSVFDSGESAHGTHVAGTIGAVGNNGLGVTGLNWQVKIMPLKFIGPEGGYNSGAIAAIEYAASKGVKVLNASYGGNYFGQGVFDATDAAGILFVAAAGNYSSNNDTLPFYPASNDLPVVISVAATDSSDTLASFSNYGLTGVDLGAPGVSIYSTLPGNRYGSLQGTSMASPHVAGVAGLIYSQFPALPAAEVKYRILSSVDPVASLSGKTVTGGRLNAAKAVNPPVPPSVSSADGFESNDFTGGAGSWAGGWTISGDISIRTQDGPAEGSRHVRLRRGTGYLRRTANVGGATDLRLGFQSKVSAFEAGDVSDVLISTDGANWTSAEQFTAADSDNQYHHYEIDLTPLLPLSQIHIAFDAGMNALDDNWYLDDIRLTGTPGNLPPVADAGLDRTRTDGDNNGSESLTLNGTYSFDPDGTIVSYEWTQDGNLIGTDPVLEVEVLVGTWTATLTVIDNDGAVRSDTVQLTVHGPPIEVFTDSFERGTFSPWTQDSQNDWTISTQNKTDGTRAAEVDGSASDAALISPLIDLQGRNIATITFDWLIESSLDSGEYLAVDISQDGGSTWLERRRYSGNVNIEDVWQTETLNPSFPNKTALLRFRAKMNGSDEDAFVDNIRVVAE